MKIKFWQKALSKVFLFFKGVTQRQTLGARGALIDGNKVLLIRHTLLPVWQFPGGGVDPGESFEAAFRREMFEETGYEVEGEVVLHGIFHNVEATNRDHLAFYISKNFKSTRIFKSSHEISDMAWFDIDDLPNDIANGAKRRIEEIFKAQEISQKW